MDALTDKESNLADVLDGLVREGYTGGLLGVEYVNCLSQMNVVGQRAKHHYFKKFEKEKIQTQTLDYFLNASLRVSDVSGLYEQVLSKFRPDVVLWRIEHAVHDLALKKNPYHFYYGGFFDCLGSSLLKGAQRYRSSEQFGFKPLYKEYNSIMEAVMEAVSSK